LKLCTQASELQTVMEQLISQCEGSWHDLQQRVAQRGAEELAQKAAQADTLAHLFRNHAVAMRLEVSQVYPVESARHVFVFLLKI
jgi:hypothetical protein